MIFKKDISSQQTPLFALVTLEKDAICKAMVGLYNRVIFQFSIFDLSIKYANLRV